MEKCEDWPRACPQSEARGHRSGVHLLNCFTRFLCVSSCLAVSGVDGWASLFWRYRWGAGRGSECLEFRGSAISLRGFIFLCKQKNRYRATGQAELIFLLFFLKDGTDGPALRRVCWRSGRTRYRGQPHGRKAGIERGRRPSSRDVDAEQ